MSKRDESPRREAKPPKHLRDLYRAYSEKQRDLLFIGPALTMPELQEHAAKVVPAYNDFHAATVVSHLEAFTRPYVDECRFWLGREGSVAMWVEVPKGRADDLIAMCRRTEERVFEEVGPGNVAGWVNLWTPTMIAGSECNPANFRAGCDRLLQGSSPPNL